MELFTVTTTCILLVFLPEVAFGKNEFYICNAHGLRVTEAFEASRLAARVFPCLVTDVLLKYKLPSSLILTGYRPCCLIIRFCIAMTPKNRITNRQDFDTVATCILESAITIINMGLFEYRNLPADVRLEYGNEKQFRNIGSDWLACFHQSGVENFKMGADIGIAMLRWLIDKLL